MRDLTRISNEKAYDILLTRIQSAAIEEINDFGDIWIANFDAEPDLPDFYNGFPAHKSRDALQAALNVRRAISNQPNIQPEPQIQPAAPPAPNPAPAPGGGGGGYAPPAPNPAPAPCGGGGGYSPAAPTPAPAPGSAES